MGQEHTPGGGARLGDGLALGLLAAYFLAQLLVRVAAPGSLELDEGAELLRARDFALGYGDQPPLYTWLLVPFFLGSAPAVWPLALVKQVLLFATHACVYGSGRLLGLAPASALAASAAMLWLPQIGWESQRDLTHSVLVTCAAAATLLVTLHMVHGRRGWHAPALGLAVAAGLLAKYNFALFLLALGAAALSVPAFRRALAPRDWAVAVGVAVVLTAPHGLWLLEHPAQALGDSAAKLDPREDGGPGQALVAYLAGLAGFFAPLVLFLPLLPGRHLAGRRPLPAPGEEARRLLERFLAAAALALLALALVIGAEEVKARWLQPLFFAAPLALVARLEPARLRPWRLRGLTALLALAPLLLLAGRAADIHASGHLGQPSRYGVPFARLIAAADLPRGATVFAADAHLGGALYLFRPDLAVQVAGDGAHPGRSGGPCMLAWSDDKPRWRRRMMAWLEARYPGPVIRRALREARTRAAPYPGSEAVYRLHTAPIPCPGSGSGEP